MFLQPLKINRLSPEVEPRVILRFEDQRESERKAALAASLGGSSIETEMSRNPNAWLNGRSVRLGAVALHAPTPIACGPVKLIPDPVEASFHR